MPIKFSTNPRASTLALLSFKVELGWDLPLNPRGYCQLKHKFPLIDSYW
jgi:hypothetical protein